MKKFLLGLLTVLTALGFTFALSACDDEEKKDNRVVVTYYLDENSQGVATAVLDGKFSLAKIPQKTGYNFAGMYDSPSGGTKIVDENGSTVFEITSSISLYARWQPKTYTFLFRLADCTLEEQELSVTFGEKIPTLPTPTPLQPNKKFVGWITPDGKYFSLGEAPLESTFGESYASLAQDGVFVLTSAIDFKKFTVVFNYQDRDYTKKSITFDYGDKLENLPTLDTGSSEIVAWSLSPSQLVTPDETVTSDLVLYAIWKDYKLVNFVYGDGDTRQEKVHKESEGCTFSDGEKAGYEFLGWYDTAHFAGLPIESVSFNFLKDTYYAKWQIAIYTIDYVTDEPLASETYQMGSGKALQFLEKTGYTFNGWCTDEELTSEPAYSLSDEVYGDLTLYPKFTANQYVVNLDANEGEVSEKTVMLSYEQSYRLPVPTRTGYTFTGWLDGKEDGNKLTGGDGAGLEVWTTMQNGTTLYAEWTANVYVITFETNGGTSVSPIRVEYGKEIPFPEAPMMIGKLFDGWFNEDYSESYVEGTKVTGNTTLYAKWIDSTPIGTAAELKAIANDTTANYHLTADINLDAETWSMLSSYSGVFNGNGHKIYNFALSGSGEYLGFIKENKGSIKDITFENVTFNFTTSVKNSYGGIIAAVNNGTISGCTMTGGKFQLTGTGTTLNEYTHFNVGSIAGVNYGTIINCKSFVNMSLNATTYAPSWSNSWRQSCLRAGGITAMNGGKISYCTVEGNVTATGNTTKVNDWPIYCELIMRVGGIVGENVSGGSCYRSGMTGVVKAVVGTAFSDQRSFITVNAGGFVGYNTGATISECYSAGSVVSNGKRFDDKNNISRSGGFAGYIISGTISDCYSTAAIAASGGYHDVGGFAGYSNGIVKNCYATGGATTSAAGTCAGFIGWGDAASTTNACFSTLGNCVGGSAGIVNNCYRLEGQSGNSLSATATAEQLQSAEFLCETLYWKSEIWSFTEGEYPKLAWQE